MGNPPIIGVNIFYSTINLQSVYYLVGTTGWSTSFAGKTATLASPKIATQPTSSQTVIVGASVRITVDATGLELVYQWKKNGTAVNGATTANYTINTTATGDAGNYTVELSNTYGSVTSGSSSLTVIIPLAPTISTQPTSVNVTSGASASFTVTPSGTAPLTYQWSKGGVAIAGAKSAIYTIAAAQTDDAGSYTVSIANAAGAVTSTAATLTVSAISPTISTPPANTSVVFGASASFTVTASGTAPLTYQWSKGGVAIAGATLPAYTIASAKSTDAGSFVVVVANAAGSVTSNAAALTVNPSAYLSNVSVRTTLAAAQTLIVGLTVSGGSKPILLRGAGPVLTQFGLTTAMADPRLDMYQGSRKISENDNWDASLASTFARLGAFAFGAGSKDAALLPTLSGGYSAHATGNGPGVLLVEGYDAGSGTGARLTNISARNLVGTGADILIAGFTIAGSGTKTVLMRAVGPTLSAFGVGNVLGDPKLGVYAGTNLVAENDDWAASLAPTFASVGAFGLAANSKDSALVVTLPAGGYTAQVSGASNSMGEALIEIYELP
jgi:hypothetical protein